MPCPICSHTLAQVFASADLKVYHCGRCGVLRRVFGDRTEDTIPRLVERCVQFQEALLFEGSTARLVTQWHALGIAESIRLPEDRALCLNIPPEV